MEIGYCTVLSAFEEPRHLKLQLITTLTPTTVDTRSEKEKAIDAWLPITSSRNAKWWYSAFHNVTAMVGAGVLGLPYAMAELGWSPGVSALVISWVVTLYTLWQMVEMHEIVPGKRFDRYHELGQHAFGEKLSLYIVMPQQLIVEISVNILYMVTGGKSLKKFHDVVCKGCSNIKLTYFIMIFSSVHFVLSHLPNFNSISGASLAAAVMSLSYSTIAWAASLHKGVQPHVEYGYKAKTTVGTVLTSSIQATIPSTPEKPSKGPMWKGVIVAYIVVALCYFPVSLIGYWVFGNKIDDDILITLEKPAWLIAMANLFAVVHIYAMPVFDMIEIALVKKLHFKPTMMLRFITRNIYVVLPCVMWLASKKPEKFSLSWLINWICIILGVLLMIVSPIGGLSQRRNFGAAGTRRSLFNLKFPFKSSIRQIHMENNHKSDSRGALIVLEGLDRSGKTLQSRKLISYLEGLSYSVESWRFPDRNTGVGQMISSYLANKSELDDHAIHLLFSANRWEKRSLMENKLRSGTTLIVDRYSFSGVAFSSAKGLDIEWCKAPEMGLLAPDLVLYLDIPPEGTLGPKAAEKGDYGGERYEQLEFQRKVARSYQILHDASWKISLMENKLRSGTTLIVDRYSFSGVAFSSAKGLDIEWCKAPEMGLLAPDLVLYLDIPPEKAAEKGDYGGERYEQLEFQRKVARSYQILHDASWKTIDACLPIEDVEQ
ncbi:unnamed protein product [Camellia sinensis]